MKYRTKLTYKIYFQHIRRYRLAGSFLLFSVIAGTIANLAAPLVYKNFFDVLSSGREPSVVIPELVHLLFLVFVVFLFAWFFWRSAEFLSSYFHSRIMADLTNSCFRYLHKHSYAFFQDNFVGALVKRVNRFYSAFDSLSDKFFWDVVPMATLLIVTCVVLFLKNPLFAWIVIAWTLIFMAVNYGFSVYKLKYDVRRSALDTKVTGVLADTITNHNNIKLFSAFEREARSFADVVDELRYMRRFTWDLGHVMLAVQTFLMIALEIGLFYFAVKLWARGEFTVGDFVLLQAYVLSIFHRLWDFGRVVRDIYEQLADAEEMTEILDTPHEIVDTPQAKKLKVHKGAIDFVDVDFTYQQTRSVLAGLNLHIRAGERVALVGPSGAGKSTIVKLLLRMHEVSGGRILIDEQNISDVTQDSLHDAISLVPQDPILFHRPLRENIAYGKPGATEKEIIAAAKAAHCHEFISGFPDGYETYVGERGVKLSGGERQRVAIARAILRNAPILVLDEATSSLDSESEALIQDALQTLMRGKTVIVIAHRLSTIMKMDRIVVIDEGKIVESGTHEELTKKKRGLYAKLWNYQAGGFLA